MRRCWSIKCASEKYMSQNFVLNIILFLQKSWSDYFWADETMKCNYVAFGDVVSFDATFHTNKYGYKFVPFIGIDHNQRCVTFGAALLSDETT
nr:protein FAR1-related sequence 5-like [Tanacetum cinerariifolium]